MSQIRLRRVGIRCICQESTNTDTGSWKADLKNGFDSRIDIAVDFAIRPVVNVIASPDDGVNERQEIQDTNPPDEDESRPWSTRDLPVEVGRGQAKDKTEAGEDCEGDVCHDGGWHGC